VHPDLIAALAEDRRKSCPCGAVAEPSWELCRKCIARITWRRRTRRPYRRAIRRHVGRQIPDRMGVFAPTTSIFRATGKGAEN
jgi:hypothetical protein